MIVVKDSKVTRVGSDLLGWEVGGGSEVGG